MTYRVTAIAAITAATILFTLVAVGNSSNAAFPGSNGPIIFSSDGDDGFIHIFSRPAAGGSRTQLTTAEANDFNPAVTALGDRIAFLRQPIGIPGDIWIMNIDGSDQHMVPNTNGSGGPSWSPDGTQLTFDMDGAIFTISADGSDLQNITPTFDSASQPDWSPAGNQIAFVVDEDDSSNIYVFNLGDPVPGRLTQSASGIFARDPDWSPDQLIAFTERDRDTGESDVITVRVDGSDRTNLTDDAPGHQSNPAWSPSASHSAIGSIAYEQHTADVFPNGGVGPAGIIPTQIFTMDRDGSNKQNFTSDQQLSEIHPEWATVEHTPTPTAPHGDERIWGDLDCDGEVSSRDNQGLLRIVLLQNPISQTEPCPNIGETVTTLLGSGAVPAGNPQRTQPWGDLDCDQSVSSRDNQTLLRAVLEQTPLTPINAPCPEVGDTKTVLPND